MIARAGKTTLRNKLYYRESEIASLASRVRGFNHSQRQKSQGRPAGRPPQWWVPVSMSSRLHPPCGIAAMPAPTRVTLRSNWSVAFDPVTSLHRCLSAGIITAIFRDTKHYQRIKSRPEPLGLYRVRGFCLVTGKGPQ